MTCFVSLVFENYTLAQYSVLVEARSYKPTASTTRRRFVLKPFLKWEIFSKFLNSDWEHNGFRRVCYIYFIDLFCLLVFENQLQPPVISRTGLVCKMLVAEDRQAFFDTNQYFFGLTK